jgi:hypothetical protein
MNVKPVAPATIDAIDHRDCIEPQGTVDDGSG